MSIAVDNSHPRLRVDHRGLARHLRRILADQGRSGALVDVQLVDDETIHALNAEWRGVDDATDVLSFALEDEDDGIAGAPISVLGDIVISLDTAQRQAAALRRQLRDAGDPRPYPLRLEAFFLATHGVLHLLGFDHIDEREALEMEALERRYMAALTEVDIHSLDRTDHARGQR